MNKYRAECTQCPRTINPDWGNEEAVYVEYIDEGNALSWAEMHNDATGHSVYMSISFTMHTEIHHVSEHIKEIIFDTEEDNARQSDGGGSNVRRGPWFERYTRWYRRNYPDETPPDPTDVPAEDWPDDE